MGKKQKQKIVLPPDLPPEIPDDEVEISDDDLQFVKENRGFASLLSTLDTKSITKFVLFLKGFGFLLVSLLIIIIMKFLKTYKSFRLSMKSVFSFLYALLVYSLLQF